MYASLTPLSSVTNGQIWLICYLSSVLVRGRVLSAKKSGFSRNTKKIMFDTKVVSKLITCHPVSLEGMVPFQSLIAAQPLGARDKAASQLYRTSDIC